MFYYQASPLQRIQCRLYRPPVTAYCIRQRNLAKCNNLMAVTPLSKRIKQHLCTVRNIPPRRDI
jgi:hypothetical protein